ncbi:MAG TPA: GDP-mannose 4,6-dehydratase [Solimonas sp.]|nr:GDP-mannose 4,6-dehydratase [Solimonas sp.]
MPDALVLGVNGQDGSYLAEALLRRGYRVTGAARQPHSRYVPPSQQFRYVALDLRDTAALQRLLQESWPDLVFHAAAVHGAAGFTYEPVWGEMMAVNVVAVHTVLEHARTAAPTLRLAYASSAKIFPEPWTGRIDERTPAAAACLYSIGKIAALDLIRQYRKRHGIAGANLILFNHESPRRPANFFVPTLARGIAAALRDPAHRLQVKTLDFRSDWSAAEELMDIAVDIAEKAPAEDFVLGSGVTREARTAVREAFARHGLEADRHVVETLPRSAPGPAFEVALDHLEARIGRRPQRDFASIVDELVGLARAA